MTHETEFSLHAASHFRHHVAARARLFALVDAAREPIARLEAEAADLRIESLFSGSVGARMANVAPHIADFPDRSEFRGWWFDQWGRSVGVVLESTVEFEELQSHLRSLLMVGGSDGRRFYFRFYDPRVLTVFLPACNSDELQRVFGPINAFYCEGAGGAELVAFSRAPNGCLIEKRTAV